MPYPYQGEMTEPKWHITVKKYKKGELYSNYAAICGYETPGILTNVSLSIAKRPPKGSHCKRCLKEWAELTSVEP